LISSIRRESEFNLADTYGVVFAHGSMKTNWRFSFNFKPIKTANAWQSFLRITDNGAGNERRVLGLWLIPNTLNIRMTPFSSRVHTALQHLTPKIFFSNDELHIILKRSYLEICKHSSFLLLTKLSFKSSLKFRNLKLSKLSLLIKPIEYALEQ